MVQPTKPMTPHITYNAGKFYYDIHVVAVSTKGTLGRFDEKIGFVTFKDGDTFPIPATLRAEVEYQIKGPSGDWVTASKGDYEFYHPARKVVRLVEVESKAEPSIKIKHDGPHQRLFSKPLPQPEKQAIDERVELNVLELARAYANLQKIDYPVHNGHKAAIKAQIREAFYSGYESSQPPPAIDGEFNLPADVVFDLQRIALADDEVCYCDACRKYRAIVRDILHRSSQPPPQAESQWISVKDGLPEYMQCCLIHVDTGFVTMAQYGAGSPGKEVFVNDQEWYIATHWMPLPTSPFNPKH